MAEAAIGLGSSILSIAAFGASVVTTLRTFTASYSRAEQRVTDLSVNIALTTSILTELGNTIKQHEVEIHITATNFLEAKSVCEENFEKLRKALRVAKSMDRGEKGNLKGKGRLLGPWEKLMFALGGEDELKDLVVSIETSKSTLQLLLESVKLFILRKLHKLSEDQMADLRLLRQQVLRSIQASGLRDIILPQAEVPVLSSANVKLGERAVPLNPSLNHQPTNSADIHTNSQTHNGEQEDAEADVEVSPLSHEIDGTSTDPPLNLGNQNLALFVMASQVNKEEHPQLQDTISKERREEEMPEDEERELNYAKTPTKLPLPSTKAIDGAMKERELGVAAHRMKIPKKPPQIISMPGKIKNLDEQSTLQSRSHSRPPSIYESWLLTPQLPPSPAPPPLYIHIFCLTLKIHHSASPSYNLVPHSTSKFWLKNLIISPPYKSKNRSLDRIAVLPEHARMEAERLLKERNGAASKGFGWEVVECRDWEKGEWPTWLIILEGGPIRHLEIVGERYGFLGLPRLDSDPWGEDREAGRHSGSVEILIQQELGQDHAKEDLEHGIVHARRARGPGLRLLNLFKVNRRGRMMQSERMEMGLECGRDRKEMSESLGSEDTSNDREDAHTWGISTLGERADELVSPEYSPVSITEHKFIKLPKKPTGRNVLVGAGAAATSAESIYRERNRSRSRSRGSRREVGDEGEGKLSEEEAERLLDAWLKGFGGGGPGGPGEEK